MNRFTLTWFSASGNSERVSSREKVGPPAADDFLSKSTPKRTCRPFSYMPSGATRLSAWKK